MATFNITRGSSSASTSTTNATNALAVGTTLTMLFVNYGDKPVRVRASGNGGVTLEDDLNVSLNNGPSSDNIEESASFGFTLPAGSVRRASYEVTAIGATAANNTITFTGEVLHAEASSDITVGVVLESTVNNQGL